METICYVKQRDQLKIEMTTQLVCAALSNPSICQSPLKALVDEALVDEAVAITNKIYDHYVPKQKYEFTVRT